MSSPRERKCKTFKQTKAGRRCAGYGTPSAEAYYKKMLRPAIGGKLVDFIMVNDGHDEWPVLVLENRGKIVTIQISMDEEGNGPGAFFVTVEGSP
jgi:hypothetical protein